MNNSILFTIYDVYLLIKNNIMFVCKLSVVFLTFAIIYTFIGTKYYASYISINPQDSDQSSMTSIMNMSAMLGISSTPNNTSSFYIPDIINSRKLKKDIVKQQWNTLAFEDSVNLIEYWEIEYNKDNDLNIKSDRFLEEEAIGRLENNLYVFEEESGLIKVRVLMEEPQLAADIANYISNFLDNYIGNELRTKSTEYREFVENRLQGIQMQLSVAQDSLYAFKDKYPIVPTKLDKKFEQLITEVEKQRRLDLYIAEEYEKAITEEQYKKPIFDLLDYADPNPYPYWPNNILIYMISLFIGLMTSIIILVSSKALSKKS